MFSYSSGRLRFGSGYIVVTGKNTILKAQPLDFACGSYCTENCEPTNLPRNSVTEVAATILDMNSSI